MLPRLRRPRRFRDEPHLLPHMQSAAQPRAPAASRTQLHLREAQSMEQEVPIDFSTLASSYSRLLAKRPAPVIRSVNVPSVVSAFRIKRSSIAAASIPVVFINVHELCGIPDRIRD